jgi:isopenicillin N synthase-like dioxygenase
MQRIPLIDLGNTTGVTREIEKACRDIGFMYVAGHAISPRLIDDVRITVKQYFSQPENVKLRDRISPDNYRGYIPKGFFSANSGDGAADSYEGYKLHCEVPGDDPIRETCDLYGPNKWPAHPLNIKQHLLAYWQECDRVANVLLGAMADVLGIDDLLECFESPLTNMTLLHYPPQSPDAAGFGIHPHKDTDALTILAQDPVGGLMVKCRDSDEWIDASPPGNALTVNIGDLMELWSGGYFVSTPHKVVNLSGAERYSFPYFAVPRFDTVVGPLKTPQPGFLRSSVHVGDVSKEVWRTNWPDIVSDKPYFDLGTLED